MRIRSYKVGKVGFRRGLKAGQRQVEDFGAEAERQIERHLLRRYERLAQVWRFVIGWAGLMLLLIVGLLIQNLALNGYYQTLRPVPGGIYNEGVLGRFTTANPLYAVSDADSTVSHLLFAGLLKYDGQGRLVGDLASGYSTDDHGLIYTLHLRPHLTWQDSRPLTSADVVFTYHLIQNPDARSPFQGSWRGIDVSAPDAQTVVFKLPGTLASFPYNLTTGIVPQHLLAKIPPTDLRSADFNTVNPVGAGPFAWQAIQVSSVSDPGKAQEQVALRPFTNYAGGKPHLQTFVVHAYSAPEQLLQAFNSGQLTAAEGLQSVPQQVQKKHSVIQHSLTLRAADMVFFKTTSGIMADQAVRHALVQAANVPAILSHLGYPARSVNEPLLTGQLGYNPAYAQPKYDPSTAAQALNADGWIAKNGPRYKNNQKLIFTLSAANTPDNHLVAKQLQQQWGRIGVAVNLNYLDNIDFQNAVNYHDYDALLDGISIGEDSDVFVYWDSSQADIRSANQLNLSEYKNATVDASLEAGRSRLDPAIRIVKYRPFLQAWQQDSPALGLYQPRLLYLTNGPVAGITSGPINSPIDRLANVQNWEIRQAKVTD